jgi:hypothetical protein
MESGKKILPVVYPPVTTFTAYAAELAILFNYEKTYDWLYSHYLQVYVLDIINRYENDNGVPFIACFFGDFDNRRLAHTINDFVFLRREVCPYLDIFEVPNDLIDTSGETAVEFFKRSIDHDLYLYSYLDVSHIKQYGIDTQYGHEVFIYGYDDEKKVFHFADFPIDDSSRYSFSTCSYEEIERAYLGIEHHMFPLAKSVGLIRYTDLSPYTFNPEYVRDTVREYIYPDKERAERFNSYTVSYYENVDWKTKTYIGSDVYEYLSNVMEFDLSRGKDFIDHRLFHAMYDHKNIMLKRLAYFLQKGYLSGDKTELAEEYKSVRDQMMAVRNQVIKFNMQKNRKSIDKIKRMLGETKDRELLLLKRIFDIE